MEDDDWEILIEPVERTPEEEAQLSAAIAQRRKEYWRSMSFAKRTMVKFRIRRLGWKFKLQDHFKSYVRHRK